MKVKQHFIFLHKVLPFWMIFQSSSSPLLCPTLKNDQKFGKNEEKPCHGNLNMRHPKSTYGSVSEAGEFGLELKKAVLVAWWLFIVPIKSYSCSSM